MSDSINRPWPEIVEEWAEELTETPRTIRERMEETVDAYFGSIIMPIVKESLLDKLEQDVKDWLFDYSKTIKE